MKKEVIIEALKKAEIELDEGKLKEFLHDIQVANDADVKGFKLQISDLEAKHAEALKEKEDLIAEKNAQIASFDTAGYEDLKKYKTENEARLLASKQEDAVKAFLKDNQYSSNDVLMTYIMNKIKPEFDDDFKIKNSEAVLAGLNEHAKQYKITEQQSGATATTPPAQADIKATPTTLRDALAQKFNMK